MMFLGCDCSLSLVPSPMFCRPGFSCFETKLNKKACLVINNKACVVYKSDVDALFLSNLIIKLIYPGFVM